MTGITSEMVRNAPGVEVVMREAADFAGTHPLVAHNAAFDRKFWDAELRLIHKHRRQEFACSMLLARRLYPNAPNHKLGTLIQTLRLPATGRSHRALADAEATAYLLLHIQHELQSRFRLSAVSHELLLAIQSASRGQLEGCIHQARGAGK